MKTSITASELKDMIKSNIPIMVLDVRSREEYEKSHISIAGNLPIQVIEDGLFIPEPGRIVVTVCGKGAGRSERAAAWFRIQSQTESYYLEGGTEAWG